jgi:N-acetylglucosamine kinase-like BadF-type ATPase
VSVYLAVDGGNSKTDVIVGTDDGRVLAYATGPGTCYQTIGLPETMTRLRDMVAAVRASAGLDGPGLDGPGLAGAGLAGAGLAEADLDGAGLAGAGLAGADLERPGLDRPDLDGPGLDGAFDRAEVYLAGADLPEEVEMLTAAVTEQRWARVVRLDNDMFALLRAGTDGPDAVAVVCGAGTNCLGRARDGRLARFPGLGEISGDWGGGAHLARLTLWHAVRAEDGRGPATDLARAVADHFGLSTADEVARRLHLGEVDRAGLLDLTPVLFEVAAAGDPVARDVVARQADEIVAFATVAARRLDLLDTAFDVVLGGGVLRARHRLLMDAVTAGVAAVAPRATVVVVDAPPVLGAGLSALDALGSDPAAHAALRRALAHPPK